MAQQHWLSMIGRPQQCALMKRFANGNLDPVYEDENTGKWWFCDETWADACGPYESYDAAKAACDDYACNVLGVARDVLAEQQAKRGERQE